MKDSKLKIAAQVVLFALVGVAILYFMWQSLGAAYSEECATKGIPASQCSLFDKLMADFKSANYFWLVVISVCFFLSQLFRSIRWCLLLKAMNYEVSLFNSIACTLVGYFANLGVPRIGEFVRAGFISKYEQVPVEKAFATIVIERIVDVLMLLILIALGLVFHFDSLWGYISGNATVSGKSLAMGAGIIVLLSISGLIVLRKIRSLSNEGLHPILARVKSLIDGFILGLNDIRKLPQVGLFWLYSIGIWVMYFLMHYLAFFSFKPTAHLSPIDAILVFDFGSIGIVFPSPGGMGSYHFMIKEALAIFGVNPVDGFSFAMITFFTLTIFCTIIAGLISLILLPIVNHVNESEQSS